jgi:flavin-dependent dehydrogenase
VPQLLFSSTEQLLNQLAGAAPSNVTTDVCIIGGGPAGACAARSLARQGYRVVLIERSNPRRPSGESLAPSAAALLHELGLFARVTQTGALVCGRTVTHWSTPEPIARDVAPSLMVERSRFDQVLRAAAAEAGADVWMSARAHAAMRRDGRWIVPVSIGSELLMVHARMLIDASGRRAGRTAAGVPTIALSGRWRDVAWSDDPELRVEAGEDCWFWGAPLPDGSVAALVFVDPARCAGLDRGGRARLYHALLRRATLLAPCLTGTLVGDIRVRDATCRVADTRLQSEMRISIGDAALAMDPISSHGVTAAMRSGVQAGIIAHTILSGGDAEAALEFHRDTLLQATAVHRRAAGALYAGQALHRSAFWDARSTAPPVPDAPPAGAGLPPAHQSIRLSPSATTVTAPTIDGNVVRRRAAIIHPAIDRPVAWLAGIELAPALAALREARRVDAVLSEWTDTAGRAAAARALGWLMERGILLQE